jgi:hypothetical protein
LNVRFKIQKEEQLAGENQQIISLLEITLEDFPFTSLFSIRRTTKLIKIITTTDLKKRELEEVEISSELIAQFKPTQEELAELLKLCVEVQEDYRPPFKLRVAYLNRVELYIGLEMCIIEKRFHKRRELRVYVNEFAFVVPPFPLTRLIFELNDYCNLDTEEIQIIKTRLAIRRKLLGKIFDNNDKLSNDE